VCVCNSICHPRREENRSRFGITFWWDWFCDVSETLNVYGFHPATYTENSKYIWTVLCLLVCLLVLFWTNNLYIRHTDRMSSGQLTDATLSPVRACVCVYMCVCVINRIKILTPMLYFYSKGNNDSILIIKIFNYIYKSMYHYNEMNPSSP